MLAFYLLYLFLKLNIGTIISSVIKLKFVTEVSDFRSRDPPVYPLVDFTTYGLNQFSIITKYFV